MTKSSKMHDTVWQYVKLMNYFTIRELELLLIIDRATPILLKKFASYIKYLHRNGVLGKSGDTYFINHTSSYFTASEQINQPQSPSTYHPNSFTSEVGDEKQPRVFP